MKLRLLDDSVRLRLSRTEVAALGAGRRVEAATNLPTGALTYAVIVGEELAVDLSGSNLVVTVPQDEVESWAVDDHPVGIHGTVGSVAVAVEKDFQCLIPRPGVDRDDFYPNPKTPRD